MIVQEDHGWRARISMRLGPREGRTRVRALSHRGPLRLQRVFHPEPCGAAHVYLLHPPGGLVGGDRLAIEARVDTGGAALITTPGAAKIYRTTGPRAHVRTELTVATGACLEHTPQETIVFDGACASLTTRVVLHDGAQFLGWEITCLGRPACGEKFERGSLRLALEVVNEDDRPRLIERGLIEAGGALMRSAWGLRDRTALGTFVATHGELDAIRDLLAQEEATVSATRISELVVVRAMGRDSAAVRRIFERVRHHVRACWTRPAIDPAIWRT